ncbi:MAG: D-sedoheptulose 7-phosphate isomerase [Phycisphaerales bacterium]|jgi:D-sedoheptulose 7-phosphate isomerase|nr:D-sedoheptulose 7-phosphate isomerase [Phycisphaerales bacterium]
MKQILNKAIEDTGALLPKLLALEPQMTRLAEAMMAAWSRKGKILVAGNGGSACDAMHLAEELVARFQKNRKALAAIALCDPTVITCAANDFGFESVFARQVEALGNTGDVLIVFSTSGNSPNILRAIETAKRQGVLTAAFLGRDGGKARGMCDIELIVPAQTSHRIQEGHQILYHSLCEWVDARVD